jgi:hypothetical protein
LLELRIQWRRELENVIGSAPELQWRWAADWAKPSRWGPQARRDKQLTNHILPELFRLPSIRMAYFIDLCLAEATETLPEMLGNVLPHEIRMLDRSLRGCRNWNLRWQAAGTEMISMPLLRFFGAFSIHNVAS